MAVLPEAGALPAVAAARLCSPEGLIGRDHRHGVHHGIHITM